MFMPSVVPQNPFDPNSPRNGSPPSSTSGQCYENPFKRTEPERTSETQDWEKIVHDSMYIAEVPGGDKSGALSALSHLARCCGSNFPEGPNAPDMAMYWLGQALDRIWCDIIDEEPEAHKA
jgi:hypothetical protein